MSNSSSQVQRNNYDPNSWGIPAPYVGPNCSRFGTDYFEHRRTGLRVEIVESSSRNPEDPDSSSWTVKARADGEPARQVHQHHVTSRSAAFEIAAEWMQDNPEGQLPSTWFDWFGREQTEGQR